MINVAGTRRVPSAVAGTRRVPSIQTSGQRGRHTACACYIPDREWLRVFLLTILAGLFALMGPAIPAAETPRRGLKVVVARDAAPEVRQAAEKLLAAVPKHPLLSILAGDTPPARLTDSGRLAEGPAEARAYDHLVLIGLPDDPMVKAAWQREARVEAKGWYLFGFGHLQGELGYVESDRNPFLHAAAIPKAPYETEAVTLTGSTVKGVALAVAALLDQRLINGVVAAPGWRRPAHSLLERDPLAPGFHPTAPVLEQAGSLRQIGVTQASEDEYRGVLEDTGLKPQVIWRWKYYRAGVWDGAGAERAFDHYAAGLHRRAYGNTLWAAQFASAKDAAEAAPKVAAAAKLKRRADAWEGEQPPYGSGKGSPGPLTLWRTGAWLWMSTLPPDAATALRSAARQASAEKGMEDRERRERGSFAEKQNGPAFVTRHAWWKPVPCRLNAPTAARLRNFPAMLGDLPQRWSSLFITRQASFSPPCLPT